MLANINGKANYTINDIKKMYEDDYETLLNIIAFEDKYRHIEGGQAKLSRDIGEWEDS